MDIPCLLTGELFVIVILLCDWTIGGGGGGGGIVCSYDWNIMVIK